MTEITRKLASIRVIKDVQPIEGADSIELVFVDGWQVVTRKGEFKPKDWCIYFEIDSFLPIHPLFEFLRASSFRDIPELGQGFRLKSIKLRKQLSQGLVTKLDETMEQFGSPMWTPGKEAWVTVRDDKEIMVYLEEGADVTEYLGVKKFEIPISAQLAGLVRGNFPSFIPKTDQERVQNLVFHDGAAHEVVYTDGEGKEIRVNKAPRPGPCQFDYEMTMKLDGSSMTVYRKDGYVGVCSRNMDLIETEENAYWKAAKSCGLIDFLRKNEDELSENIAFQGELMGPGVQDNREGLSELVFYLFDVFAIDDQVYASPSERMDIYFYLVKNDLNLEHVPLLDKVMGADLTMAKCLELAQGPSIYHKVREGVVFKSLNGTYSFKAINNDFLLGEK